MPSNFIKRNDMKSSKDAPLWMWILRYIGGILTFFILYGISMIPGMIFTQNKMFVIIGSIVLSLLVLLFYYGWVRILEGGSAADVRLKDMLPETGKGLLIGLFYFIVVVGLMMIFGLYRIRSANFDAFTQLTQLFFFLTVAVGEEIIFRGILFRMIDERWNTWIALIVSTVVFGLVHAANPNATWWSTLAIALESGFLLGASYKYSGSLYLPIGIHWAWNYSQGNIFGFAVSGNDFGTSIITPHVEGPGLLTGGAFGAEASMIAVVVGMLFASWFIRKIWQRQKAEII